MSAIHPESQGVYAKNINDHTRLQYWQFSKEASLQNTGPVSTFPLISKGINVNAATTFPILNPFVEPSTAATIDLDLGAPTAHYQKISITEDDTTINFTNTIRGRSMRFILDITINTATFNSITYSPNFENPPTGLPTSNGSRYLLNCVVLKTNSEEVYFVISASVAAEGGSNVPDGTALNDHLEWNGTDWTAVQNLSFATASLGAPGSGRIRMPNAGTISWFNAAETETYLFGVGPNDFFNIIGTKLDMNAEDIINVDRFLLSVQSEAFASPSDVGIVRSATSLKFNVDDGDSYSWNILNVESAQLVKTGATPDPAFVLFGNDDEIPLFRVQRIDSTPNVDQVVGRYEFWGVDSSGSTLEEYARIEALASDLTVGNVSGTLYLRVERNDNSVVFMALNDSDDNKITTFKNLLFDTAIDIEMNGNDVWLDAGQTTKLSGTATGFNVNVGGTFVATFGTSSLVMQPNFDITTRGILLTPTTNTFLSDGQLWYNSTTNKFQGRENGTTVDIVGGGSGNSILQGNSNVTVTDAGTGDIDFTVDGTSRMNLIAGSLTMSVPANVQEIEFVGITTPGSLNRNVIYSHDQTNDDLVLNVNTDGNIRFQDNGTQFATFGDQSSTIQASSSGSYSFQFYRDSGNDDDVISTMLFQANDDVGTPRNYVRIEAIIEDSDDNDIDGIFKVSVADAGPFDASFLLQRTAFDIQREEGRIDLQIIRNEPTAATGTIGNIVWQTQRTGSSTLQTFAEIDVSAEDVTNNLEDVDISFMAVSGGSIETYLRFIGVGEPDDGLYLGFSGNKIGFYGEVPVTRPIVTGSRGGNVALTNFLLAANSLGLIDDQTTA